MSYARCYPCSPCSGFGQSGVAEFCGSRADTIGRLNAVGFPLAADATDEQLIMALLGYAAQKQTDPEVSEAELCAMLAADADKKTTRSAMPWLVLGGVFALAAGYYVVTRRKR
jgi:hypothetical protein